MPGYLHLPRQSTAEAVPCVLTIGGMDSFKEMAVALYGDKFLERDIAVLAMDGPGQGECTVRDIHVTATNFMDAGRAMIDWMCGQPEIAADRLALRASSFGSFWGTQVASVDLLKEVKTPKELLLYQGERHGLNTTTSSWLGPDAQTYIADWIADRLQGKPASSQHLFVDMQGQVHARAWDTQDGGVQFNS